MTKKEYQDEPVHYCSNCLSIRIKELADVNLDICEDCGNTDIEESHFDEWNKLYVRKYNRLFLELNEDSTN